MPRMPWLRVSGTMNFLQGRWIFFNFLSIKQQPRIKFCKKCIVSTSTPGVFLFLWLKSSQHFNVRSALLQRCGPTLCWSEVGNEKIIWRWILNAAKVDTISVLAIETNFETILHNVLADTQHRDDVVI